MIGYKYEIWCIGTHGDWTESVLNKWVNIKEQVTVIYLDNFHTYGIDAGYLCTFDMIYISLDNVQYNQ